VTACIKNRPAVGRGIDFSITAALQCNDCPRTCPVSCDHYNAWLALAPGDYWCV